jgi:transposase InsO family protein
MVQLALPIAESRGYIVDTLSGRFRFRIAPDGARQEPVYHETYRARAKARLSVFQYIEGWYNRRRRHSTLGRHSPLAFKLAARVARLGVHNIGVSTISGQAKRECA